MRYAKRPNCFAFLEKTCVLVSFVNGVSENRRNDGLTKIQMTMTRDDVLARSFEEKANRVKKSITNQILFENHSINARKTNK